MTTSGATQGTSNAIGVASSSSSLSAVYYGLGSNTTYSIGNTPVSGMSTDMTTRDPDRSPHSGTGLLSFYNGTAGYTVSYTPSGGAATSDPVLGAVLNGTTVTLTLEYALANGDTLNITATGTNPPTAGSDEIDVQPGNGLPEPTSSITFGNSVAAPTLSESNDTGRRPCDLHGQLPRFDAQSRQGVTSSWQSRRDRPTSPASAK